MISPRQRRLIIQATLIFGAFLLGMLAVEITIPMIFLRHLIMSALAVVLMIVVAALLLTTISEPKTWKHIYKPQRYDTEMVPQIRSLVNRDVIPPYWVGYQERVRASLWIREALAENIELNWVRSPYEFQRILTDPLGAPWLKDKPAFRRLLFDTQDLGLHKEGSMLLYNRRKFIRLAEKVFKEVEGA